MASAASKKGKKKKGQTVNLNDFLGGSSSNAPDGTTVVTVRSQTSWADAAEDDDVDFGFAAPTQQIALPTAPRAARQEIDLSQLPDKPPYTAYVGNLSYDVDEEVLERFFSQLNVSNVRLVKEGGRMKGFGYVEFGDKQSLVDALKLTGEALMARKIKVDLATQSNNRDGGFGGDRDRDGRGSNQISGEGDADDDWRGSAAANKSTYESSSYGRSRDNGYHNREDRDGYGPPRDRHPPSEADTASSWSRGPPRSSGYEDRNGYGSSRRQYEEPPRRGYDDRDSGYGSRRGYDDRDSGYGSRRGYDDRDSGYGSRRGYDDRDSGYGSRRGYDDRDHNRRDQGRYDDRQSSDPPKERPRLQLAPRSKPVEGESPAPAPSGANKPSVFGSAKPVDTAAREREIEEKLNRDQDSRSHPSRDSRDSRDSGHSFGSRDIRTNVERKVFYAGGSEDRENERPTNDSNRAPESEVKKEPIKKPSAASIFGSAKPVDTAARERQIEERLRKERETDSNQPDEHTDRGNDSRDMNTRNPPRTNDWHRGPPSSSRGRGGERPHHKERKEKVLPQSIDEMPVYKENQSKDFSDTNKFAGLNIEEQED